MSEVLTIVFSSLGALAGGYLGVRWRARAVEKEELRRLLDDCAAVLARADQTRGGAYVLFVQEGFNTSDRGVEAIGRFREELSVAEQLRDRLRFRAAEDSPVFKHYSEALEALGRVSVALGVAVGMPPDTLFQGDIGLKQHGLMTEGEEKFKRERAAFLQAAQSEAGPPKQLLARFL